MLKKIKLRFYLWLLTIQPCYKLYSLGNCTIGVWVTDSFMNSGCKIECYYHSNVNFEEFTKTSHSWCSGKWIFNKDVKKYYGCPTEHIEEFLKLAQSIS